MRRGLLILFIIVSTLSCFSLLFANEKLIGARFPAISPEGDVIAFSYMGDLWTVPVTGGKATQITNHSAYEREPIWSPDGKWIAFTSDRMGNNDVYLMSAAGGTARQLTFHSGNDVATDFSPDGKWVIFSSDRTSMISIFKISLAGGNALPMLDTYWSWPHKAKMHPNGKTILFSLGMENGSWWRRGYRGSNSAKIWKFIPGTRDAQLVVSEKSNCFWPNWGPDGKTIYFVTDKNHNTKNIWTASEAGAGMKPVTEFKGNDVKWLSVAKKAPVAVYERDFSIWHTDLVTGKSRVIPIDAPAETKDNASFFAENDAVSEFQLSPDGKKIAAVVRGDIFVLGHEGGYARNVTESPWREKDVIWDKDSKNLIYVCDANANPDLYSISALGGRKPTQLTHSDLDELAPKLSPDGNWIAYYCGKRQIRLIQPDGKKDQLVLEGDFGGRFASDFSWSPDSRFLAIVDQSQANDDILAVNIETKEKHPLTNTAYDESSPAWSPNGKFLLFTSNRYGHSFPEFTGKSDVYQVYFEPQKPEFDEDTFEKLFVKKAEEKKDEADKKDAKKPDEKKEALKIVFKLEDLDIQTENVTNTLGNDHTFILSPKDTSTVYFVSNIDGKNHLWQTSLKKKERGKFEPFMAGVTNPGNLQFDKKGARLYYQSQGKIGYIEGTQNSSVSFTTKIKVDKTADYEQMLAELYYTLQHYYYDTNHHNVNWTELYEQFRPVLQQVREDADFYDYANEMIGFLNSSHTGIRGPGRGKIEEPSAHIGADWDFAEDKITFQRILKNGPIYSHRDSVAVGDELTAINGEPVSPDKNIWQRLNGNNGKRVRLTVNSRKLDKAIEIAIEPISAWEERDLRQEEWVKSRQAIVKQKTSDEVAYIHMSAMGYGDLERFLMELERDAVPRKGLILDLRYNFGGNVHDRVLQALTKPVYAKWRIRGLSETPQSTFGFEHRPAVLLTNEVTLSDGEMTANGFKTLQRGPIVGNTTYGWLIFTTSAGLMNGGYFRLPFWGCYTLDGVDLETGGGVTPDILVINDLKDDLNDRDPQLDRAIGKMMELVK
ncbi:MAG: S41 family peptidase [Candidatus Zhuqueibacterota bacterium]